MQNSTIDNAMRRQALSIPELLEQQYADLEPKTRSVCTFEEMFSFQNIVIVGCGDSRFAGMAVKRTFEQLTGIRTEVMSAIDFSRYYPEKRLGNAPNNPLVIIVSKSGTVARISEAAQRAGKHGAFVLGVTGNPESPLGLNSSKIIRLDIPKFESAPGVRGYLVNLIALTLFAIRLGEVRGKYTMDQAKAMRKDMKALAGSLSEQLEPMDSRMMDIADKWKDMEAFDFIGAGPEEAAANYGQAKIFEAAGKYASVVNTEEFMHLNCFMRRCDKIGTVLLCSSQSPALSRAKEIAKCIVYELKRPSLIITDQKGVFDIPEENIYVVPKPQFEINSPLAMFLPISFLAADIMAMIGEENGRGLKDNWAFCQNAAGLKNSEIIVL